MDKIMYYKIHLFKMLWNVSVVIYIHLILK